MGMEAVLAGAALIVAGNTAVAAVLVWRYQRERRVEGPLASMSDVVGSEARPVGL